MKKKTKDMIFEAAVNLFAEHGYKETSMRTIAREVGIKESSIYNHYSGKKKILQEILKYQIDAFKNCETALDELKSAVAYFTDPVEIWIIGTTCFIKKMPPLSDKISLIINKEMFFDSNCRNFIINVMYPAQKRLTEEILHSLFLKELIKPCNIEMTAAQYVHMIHGIELENILLKLQGIPEETLKENLFHNIEFFLEKLKN